MNTQTIWKAYRKAFDEEHATHNIAVWTKRRKQVRVFRDLWRHIGARSGYGIGMTDAQTIEYILRLEAQVETLTTRADDYENSHKFMCDERDALQARIDAMLTAVETARSLCAMVAGVPRKFHEFVEKQLDAIRDAGKEAK